MIMRLSDRGVWQRERCVTCFDLWSIVQSCWCHYTRFSYEKNSLSRSGIQTTGCTLLSSVDQGWDRFLLNGGIMREKFLVDFYHNSNEFYFTTDGIKIVENCSCIVPNFINNYFIWIITSKKKIPLSRRLIGFYVVLAWHCFPLRPPRLSLFPPRFSLHKEKRSLIKTPFSDRQYRQEYHNLWN